MKAWLNLRHAVPARWRAFSRGLQGLGYTVVEGCTTKPGPSDILVTWNRLREGAIAANAFESRGLPVLVEENAIWGNDFCGGHWYTVARSVHNTAGKFPVGDAARWDGLGVELAPFRTEGETVILPQRGIGPRGVAMPMDWAKRHKGRVRSHPGTGACVPLEQDLAGCGRVITWGSGAAVKALMLGITVTSEMPNWIAEQENTNAGRLAMFRRLAWAQWRIEEIASGEPFKRLLS